MLQLGTDVKRLQSILASPKLRGQMGEQSLENLLSQILPKGSYELQCSFRDSQKVDALITPTSPTTPFKIGEKTDDPLQMYLSDVCTLPINIAGVPAISIPAGFDESLPVGMQIIAKPFAEETILKIANAYQQATDWHKQKPPL